MIASLSHFRGWTALATVLALSACSTPTLVQVARRSGSKNKDDITAEYRITDWDVLNYTDEVKRKLANRGNFHMGLCYGSATTQSTFGALVGATATIGWAACTASFFGMGATYIFGLGQIFGAKDQVQAYETAATAINKAESDYYLHQVGYVLELGSDGKARPVFKEGRDHGDNIPTVRRSRPYENF